MGLQGECSMLGKEKEVHVDLKESENEDVQNVYILLCKEHNPKKKDSEEKGGRRWYQKLRLIRGRKQENDLSCF